MILKKIMIRYYSDNLEKSKVSICEILKDFGIFELELVENFTLDKLDYNENFNEIKKVWAVIFYLPNNRFLSKKIKMIEDKMQKLDDLIFEIFISDIDTDSYKDEWKKSFHTTKITDKIVVNPSWEDYIAKEDEIVIHIDPAMAFGTGTHETTSLCIQLLEKYAKGNSLLDIGCGSGILMLVAKKMGFRNVCGIDIDENCRDVVFQNFEKNSIYSDFEVYIGDISKHEFKNFDVVVSNILVDVLEKNIDIIKESISNSGIAIFSGILQEKEERFIELLRKKNLKLIDRKTKNKWVGLAFKVEEDYDNSN